MAGNVANIDPYGSSASREHPKHFERPKSLIIDIHGHIRTEGVDEEVRKFVPAMSLDSIKYASPLTRELNKKQGADRNEELVGTSQRLKDMDKMCVDVMAISPQPPQFHYGAPDALGQETAEKINNNIARAVGEAPERLVGLGTVPLQNTDMAIGELNRLTSELGLKGIEIGAQIGTDELSADRLEPFWARCEELDIPILLHPTSFASDRFGAHYLTNIIGNPLDTTVAIHYLIFDGVLARYPGLKFVAVHGGGFVAAYSARMDHAWGQREDCCLNIDQPPTTYLKNIYFDTTVFSNDQLAYLGNKFGPDKILLGTDYPFDMGEYDPTEHIMGLDGFSTTDKEAMCGLNTADLLKLNVDDYSRATPAENWS